MNAEKRKIDTASADKAALINTASEVDETRMKLVETDIEAQMAAFKASLVSKAFGTPEKGSLSAEKGGSVRISVEKVDPPAKPKVAVKPKVAAAAGTSNSMVSNVLSTLSGMVISKPVEGPMDS